MSRLEPLTVGAVVLAAGASRRLGQPKQLLRLRGLPVHQTLLEQTVGAAQGGGCSPVIVVLPPTLSVSPLPGAWQLVNAQPNEGLASSVRLGIGALARTAVDAALLLVCDQPAVDADLVKMMCKTAQNHLGRVIACRYGAVQGVPAIFGRSLFAQLLELQGEQGAKHLFAAHPPVTVEFPDGIWDIDTPDDLERWQGN
ncbi:nucleotidyltransferase family protein [Deinococcus sp. Arct2-2]|uniref:nucleotidyltransferase family protein n=1 Tax=Deinococcus sp. Arct2-2 TaxID=2568653 RepID=UPI0010A47E38|nr:nucleotidyltransferase family protein [Deinococcus sp. Arct2-2]THF69571.1 nucleotidyltransferase family protein [Deinococcus sp. Arct2-2]